MMLFLESKIAEKIEISLGSYQGDAPSSFDHCASICHLGYITLDSNEISGFLSREQKRIPIGKQADFVQLVLRGCRKNSLNKYDQVGIAGLRVMGRSAHSIIHAPLTKVEVPSITPIPIVPPTLRDELDPRTRSTLDRLERLKKERAVLEDYEMAGKIKESLSSVYSMLNAFKESEKNMHQSAASEDYASAARLKADRDIKRVQAMKAVEQVEMLYLGKFDEMAGEPISKDFSLASQSLERPSPQRTDHRSNIDASHTKGEKSGEEELQNEHSIGGGHHPLLGVENAEELPAPEELSNNSTVPLDFVQKCQEMLGSYRTKCFFSKNWMLREAALAKITLLLPCLCSKTDDDFPEVMCNIIEVGVDDKNMQVYLAALVLLDELVLRFELMELSQDRTISLFSRCVTNLLSKLADSKQKVVESAELALLCMASSCCIGKNYIIRAATKRIRSKENIGGPSMKARLCFLDNLAAEFAHAEWKRIVHFVVKNNSFYHKEESVRDAAKSLIVTLMVVSILFCLREKMPSGPFVAMIVVLQIDALFRTEIAHFPKCVHFIMTQIHGEDRILEFTKDCDDLLTDRQLNELRTRITLIKRLPMCAHAEMYDKEITD